MPSTTSTARHASAIAAMLAAEGKSADEALIQSAAAFCGYYRDTDSAGLALTWDGGHPDPEVCRLVREYCDANPTQHPALTGASASAPKDRLLVLTCAQGEFVGRWNEHSRVWVPDTFSAAFLPPAELLAWREVGDVQKAAA